MKERIKVNGDKNINHNTIKGKLGLTDKKNHTTFYLEGGTFLTPRNDIEDFTDVMNVIESKCKCTIKDKLRHNLFLDNTFLMNFEICSDRMQKDKNSYLSFQYHFKQKNNANKSIINIKNENEDFFISLLNDIEKELQLFNIKPHKKRNENIY